MANKIIINSSSWFYVVLIILSAIFMEGKSEECGQEELAQCARPLQVLSATSELSFVTKKEELDKLCPDLHEGLHCIRSYTRRCMNIHQRDHFNKLYRGTSEVIHELCESGPYQEDFLRHAPCMRHVKRDYELCSSEYQITMNKIGQSATEAQLNAAQQNATQARIDEEERLKTMCCSFKEYIECSERTVRRACGNETALFTRRFLDKMSNSLMRMHCEDYQLGRGRCGEQSSYSIRLMPFNFFNIILFIIIILLKQFNFM